MGENFDALPDEEKARKITEMTEELGVLYTRHRRSLELAESVKPALTKLRNRHFPILQSKENAALNKILDEMQEAILSSMYYQAEKKLADCKAGLPVGLTKGKLKEYRKFYLGKSRPHYISKQDHQKYYRYMSDEQFEEMRKTENQSLRLFHVWEETRRKEWIAIVQEKLLGFIPGLVDLEGDYWLLLAMLMVDEYEMWRQPCEDAELILQRDLPPESLKWEYKQFAELVKNSQNHPMNAHYHEERDERIDREAKEMLKEQRKKKKSS